MCEAYENLETNELTSTQKRKLINAYWSVSRTAGHFVASRAGQSGMHRSEEWRDLKRRD
jgi:hypothetical protein